MHPYLIPVLAAFACAICNGTAAVMQKVSADKENNVNSLDVRLLWRLFQDIPYVGGIALDLVGWLFILYAIHYLPLFLVQAIIAANIAVTALIERFFRHHMLGTKSYASIITILIGLAVLAIASSPGQVQPISDFLKWLIILSPLPIGVVGYILVRSKGHLVSIGLAILGGLAFGGTLIVGRIFKFSHPIWHTIYSPLVLTLVASSVLGLLLFSISLQRIQATITNATATASQSLISAIVGITLLGDETRYGLWYLVVLGACLTFVGVIFLALDRNVIAVRD